MSAASTSTVAARKAAMPRRGSSRRIIRLAGMASGTLAHAALEEAADDLVIALQKRLLRSLLHHATVRHHRHVLGATVGVAYLVGEDHEGEAFRVLQPGD